jgi:hypothetical protein
VGRAGRVAIAAAGGLLALLVAGQLFLPRLAEHRLRDRLVRDGTVQRVEVHAFPAIELLWHHADRVVVRMGRARTGEGHLADRLAETRDTDRLDARVGELRLLTLRLHDTRLTKDGDALRGQSTVDDADLRAALPPGFTARPVASGGGSLVFEGTAELLGRRFSGEAVVGARDGRLLLTPNIPFGGFLTLTLFADPRVEVEGVGARRVPGGFVLTARARLV